MTIPTPTIVAGIDVGKSGLDAYLEPGGQARHFANTKPGRRALRNWLVQHGVTRAAFEPTGRYHRELHQCLFDSGLETVAVNPLRSRRFAEAIGRLAKNDRVDASMLARYGLLSDLAGTPPKAPILHRLNDLIAIRRKHVAQRAAQLKLHSQLAAASRAAAIIRAACSTWPPLQQSAAIPRCKPSSSASAPAASSTRSPWSPSCAS